VEGAMEPIKVVVRLKDGTVVKGKTNDFFPNKPQFHLTTGEGFIDEYQVEELKALFFVKDYDGDESYSYDPISKRFGKYYFSKQSRAIFFEN
jgi:hypothetical protein